VNGWTARHLTELFLPRTLSSASRTSRQFISTSQRMLPSVCCVCQCLLPVSAYPLPAPVPNFLIYRRGGVDGLCMRAHVSRLSSAAAATASSLPLPLSSRVGITGDAPGCPAAARFARPATDGPTGPACAPGCAGALTEAGMGVTGLGWPGVTGLGRKRCGEGEVLRAPGESASKPGEPAPPRSSRSSRSRASDEGVRTKPGGSTAKTAAAAAAATAIVMSGGEGARGGNAARGISGEGRRGSGAPGNKKGEEISFIWL